MRFHVHALLFGLRPRARAAPSVIWPMAGESRVARPAQGSNVADSRIAAEMIVPLNREGGSGTGFRAQLLFFLDDLLPSLFGKPLLSDKPDRNLIAWH
jgi:hypothetical protein